MNECKIQARKTVFFRTLERLSFVGCFQMFLRLLGFFFQSTRKSKLSRFYKAHLILQIKIPVVSNRVDKDSRKTVIEDS